MTRESITAIIVNNAAENAVCWCDGRNSLRKRPAVLKVFSLEASAEFAIKWRFYTQGLREQAHSVMLSEDELPLAEAQRVEASLRQQDRHDTINFQTSARHPCTLYNSAPWLFCQDARSALTRLSRRLARAAWGKCIGRKIQDSAVTSRLRFCHLLSPWTGIVCSVLARKLARLLL